MGKHKISIGKEACIGCGVCTSVCGNFEMQGDKAIAKKAVISEKEFGENNEAVNVCPVNAIKIEQSG